MFGSVNLSSASTSLYSADKVNIAKSSSEKLKEEENKTLDYLPVENLYKQDFNVKVLFEDPTSGKMVGINLSKSNYERLKSHFSSDDFYLRSDKQIRLNGEAQNFVSGWFSEAAYGLNWVSADTNSNGTVEGAEFQNAKLKSVTVSIGDNSVNFRNRDKAFSEYGLNTQRESAEEIVNLLIEDDVDFDGNLTYGEYFNGINPNLMSSFAQEALQKSTRIPNSNQAQDKKVSFEEKDLLEKVLENGISSLDSSELAEFRQKYPDRYQQIKQQDLGSSLSQDFKKQILNADFKMLDIKA